MAGRMILVGIGPGNISNMTAQAVAVISLCDVICGYDKYVKFLGDMTDGKQIVTSGMKGEKDRCIEAIRLAKEGHSVAVVCSGDSGVYGMAGLVYELIQIQPEIKNVGSFAYKKTYNEDSLSEGNKRKDDTDISIEIVPGITAANSGAALLGAPLMNDFAVISLSDQLTPWETIEKRLKALAAADMVVVLYNPMSHHRPDTLKRACDILLQEKPESTVCGWVRNIGRDGQKTHVTTLDKLRDEKLDMLCTVFVGASDTKLIGEKMVTSRGYTI